jgi:hypothetical protein
MNSDTPAPEGFPRYFRQEEHQYAPFIASAIFFALFVGFPLGLTLAHAAAQGSALGGRFGPLVQVHGHVQLAGWFGLFIMGMGYRLTSRFTAVKHPNRWIVPLSLACAVTGLSARTIGQSFADEGTLFAALLGVSGLLELAAALLFAGVVARALHRGRHDEFGYTRFFGAGVTWLAAAMLLNCWLVLDAAGDSRPLLPVGRSVIVAFLLLYGFASMFVFSVSVRAFPIFFGRERASPRRLIATWIAINAGIALYVGASLWNSYERADILRSGQNAGLALLGVGILGMVVSLGIFKGSPTRLRDSAQRHMRFVRSAYAWLAVAAVLQVAFAVMAELDSRPIHAFQIDAVRHFIAVGFLTVITVGMAFLVMPVLAMRRPGGRATRIVSVLLLALLHGAAASRGLGSLIANEGNLDAGYWTMTLGGTLGVIAMAVFAWYIAWGPQRPPEEIALATRRR